MLAQLTKSSRDIDDINAITLTIKEKTSSVHSKENQE